MNILFYPGGACSTWRIEAKLNENENENVPSCVWWAHPTLLVLLRARAPLTFFLTLT